MADWEPIFDGESLDGWFATGLPDRWTVSDGCIHLERPGNGSFLCRENYYGDFHVRFEYRHEPECNSGVYFRWSELTDRATGMEIQILDTHERDNVPPQAECGALYDMVAPAVDATRPAGEWNQMELRCEGSMIKSSLNGETTVDVDIDEWTTPGENPDGTENKFTGYAMTDLPRRGRLGLQDHGGQIWFRNLELKRL